MPTPICGRAPVTIAALLSAWQVDIEVSPAMCHIRSAADTEKKLPSIHLDVSKLGRRPN
jgi:hypothetical protein